MDGAKNNLENIQPGLEVVPPSVGELHDLSERLHALGQVGVGPNNGEITMPRVEKAGGLGVPDLEISPANIPDVKIPHIEDRQPADRGVLNIGTPLEGLNIDKGDRDRAMDDFAREERERHEQRNKEGKQ